MTSLGGADRAIIRMKVSRAVCSLKTGVSAGGGGTNRSRRVVGGEGPIAEICGGDGLVRPKKRGNRITKWRDANTGGCVSVSSDLFFWLVAAWVKSRVERSSVSGVNRQLHVQIGCKLRIRNRKDELTKQAKRNKLQIKPEGN